MQEVKKSDFHIGKIIRILRAHITTQYQFAEKLGVTNKHYNNIETGKVKPNWEMLVKIMKEVDAELIVKTQNAEFKVFID